MSHPREIHHSLDVFRHDHPDQDRTAFLIMSFNEKPIYKEITRELKKICESNRIILLRADDKEYHHDLFLNLQTYMHGCGIGFAVLDRIKSDDVNPNVSFEIGYMMSMFKPVLLLVDESIDGLQADLTGKLYKKFDSYNLSSLKEPTEKWLKDYGLCFSCYECAVTLDLKLEALVANRETLDNSIEDILIHAPNHRPIIKGLKNSIDGLGSVIVFEGEIEFFKQISKMHNAKRLKLSTGINVLEVASLSENQKWGESGMIPFNDGYDMEMCRLEAWAGTHDIIKEAKSILGTNMVHKIEDCSICIIKRNDSLYFIPNYISFGELYPSKIHLPLWLPKNKEIYLLKIVKVIFAHAGLTIFPSEKEIVYAHHKYIKYHIQKSILTDTQNFEFYLDGARNVITIQE